mmetsp:Transcript_32075/g.75634  ORF Transcript_32075/g.75634 Transcript_32075/m.75634 type:complete len:316 (+) Transcript_32075:360-1307(+)
MMDPGIRRDVTCSMSISRPSSVVVPANTTRPLMSSSSTHPIAQTSTGKLHPACKTLSGARHSRVPMSGACHSEDLMVDPMSASFTQNGWSVDPGGIGHCSGATRMLSVLTSVWMKECACMYSTACVSWCPTSRVCVRESAPCRFTMLHRLSPRISNDMQMCPWCSKCRSILMHPCLPSRSLRTRISRFAASRKIGGSFRMIFTATGHLLYLLSPHSSTLPYVPDPSFRTITYRPPGKSLDLSTVSPTDEKKCPASSRGSGALATLATADGVTAAFRGTCLFPGVVCMGTGMPLPGVETLPGGAPCRIIGWPGCIP